MDWVDGKPEGMVTEWYEDGQKRNEGMWQEGGRHGRSTWWYADGTKEKEVTYVSGEPDGVWTYWDSTGAMTKKQFWDRGVFLRVEEARRGITKDTNPAP
jgi:antitoxin component YwqK of YwqJK toxin-antitoxin module